MKFNFEKTKKGVIFLVNEIKYFFMSLFAQALSLFNNKDICKMHVESRKEDFTILNLVGEIDSRDLFFLRYVAEKIHRECANDITLTYINVKKSPEKEAMFDKLNLINMAWYTDLIIDLGHGKIGVSCFDDGKIDTPFQIIARRKNLIKNGAVATFAYIKKGQKSYVDHKLYVKKIAKTGYNCAVGIDKRVGLRRNMRALNFSDTSIFYAIGSIDGDDSKGNYKAFSIIRTGVDLKHGRIAQMSYYPSCFIDGGVYINDGMDSKLRVDIIHKLRRMMKGLKVCGEELYIKDIFKAISEEVPEKYAFMRNYTVNSVCSRSIEVAPGNVFFYRPQFRDKNDKKTENETKRLRLIFRVMMRKALFIFSYRKLPKFIPHIHVDDCNEAHISTIAYLRKKLDVKFIGITGSVGKTSTKDMVYEVFSQFYKTEKSIKNNNVQIRIGLNVQYVKKDTQFYIQEIGGGRPGGASRHSRMVLPEVAIVTNIGTAHLGNYDSQEDLMYNKLGIEEGLTQEGVLFLNGDDPLLWNAKTKHKVCYFAVNNKDSDYYAENVFEVGETTEFDIVHGEDRIHAKINVLGLHNVLNAVCSFAVGQHFGINEESIVKGLSCFKTSGIRQNLVNVYGNRLFIDCFNASVTSVETSLTTLAKIQVKPNNKRIAIIGDITGMGDKKDDINTNVASIITSCRDSYDKLVLYGENAAQIKTMLPEEISALAIEKRPVLESWIKSHVKHGDVILFKGSSKMKLDEIIDEIYGTNIADERYVEESLFSTINKKGVKYRAFESYVTAMRYMENKGQLSIGNTLNGKEIKKINTGCFRGNKYLQAVKLGKNILHIGSNSFADCNNISHIEHQGTIKFIGRQAFENCRNLQEFDIPKGIVVLGSSAFKNCSSLESIHIPSSCFMILKETFSGCVNLKNLTMEEGVEVIGPYAFKGCRDLTEVNIPSTVQVIKKDAFANCTNLSVVYVSEKTKVEKGAFKNCNKTKIVRVDN